MGKFYRVIKDHPLWEIGAILEGKKQTTGDGLNYSPISGIWQKIEKCSENWWEGDELVENQPEWFERVYEVGVLGKAKYLSKAAAQKAHDELYRAK